MVPLLKFVIPPRNIWSLTCVKIEYIYLQTVARIFLKSFCFHKPSKYLPVQSQVKKRYKRRRSGIVIVNLEHTSHLFLEFLLLTFSR